MTKLITVVSFLLAVSVQMAAAQVGGTSGSTKTTSSTATGGSNPAVGKQCGDCWKTPTTGRTTRACDPSTNMQNGMNRSCPSTTPYCVARPC